jgi:hypothetical protein
MIRRTRWKSDNFAYFMRVRLHRMAYFQDWLRRYFLVTLTPDIKGVRALSIERHGNGRAPVAVTITPAQLGYLLEGIDWRMPQHQ